AHSQMISDKLALAREVRVFDFLTTLGNWATTNRTTLGGTTEWIAGVSKNPLLDLHTRIKASAQRVTGIIMNPDVAFYFLADTGVRTYMRQMLGDNAPSPELARAAEEQGIITFSLIGYPPITIAPAKKLN